MQAGGKQSDSSFNPFSKFEPTRYCPRLDEVVAAEHHHHCLQDYWVVPDVYHPQIELIGSKDLVHTVGKIGEVHYPLTKMGDLLSWKGTDANFIAHYQGRIGERVLTLMLEALITGILVQLQRQDYKGADGCVLRQREHFRPGKTDTIYWNNEYLLQFDRRTTFRLMKKVRDGSRSFRYRQGKEGLELTDIDGLAWVQLDGRGKKQYLIIGESKAGRNLESNMWGRKQNGNNPDSNLFDPLRSLYPNHELVYVLAGSSPTLFASRKSRGDPTDTLTKASASIVERLYRSGVIPLVMPFPHNVNCFAMARDNHRKLRLIRERIHAESEFVEHVGED